MRERQLNLFGFDEGKADLKKRNKVIIPLDTLVLLLVVVVLLMTLVFSLGVERGRRMAKRMSPGEEISADTGSFTTPRPEKTPAADEEKPALAEDEPAAVVSAEAPPPEKRYIIQVATYVKEAMALAEAERLKKQGYTVSVSKKGNFLVLFVGEFNDRDQAQKNMQLLRKKYKDCFIRRL